MTEVEIVAPVVIDNSEEREIDPKNAVNIITDLVMADLHTPPGSSVCIWLYTSGGDTETALAIYDAIKNLKNPTTIVCMGHVMSSGLVVLQAATKRVSLPHCRFFHHCTSQEAQVLTPEMAKTAYESYLLNQRVTNDIIRSRMTISDEEWFKTWEDSTSIEFGAQEAVELGIIDSVITSLAEAYTVVEEEEDGE